VDDGAALHVLIIGSLSPAISGTVIPIHLLTDNLNARDDVRVVTVDTGGIRFGGLRGVARFFRVMWRIFVDAGRVDVVSLHINRTALALVGPVVWAVARLRHRPFIVRLFAGSGYAVLSRMSKRIARWVISRADLYLVETKHLVRMTLEEGVRNVRWYSNNRPMPRSGDEPPLRPRCRRFVSLGRLYREKGIAEMISASERFGDDVCVDIYGPFWFGTASEKDFADLKRIAYRGSVDPKDVNKTFGRYDALLLPTYDPTEGYPGVILEAYAAGLPVICTHIGGLPEIVDETCGILIAPRDADALFDAMKKLVEDDGLYRRLQEGARRKRIEYSSEVWADRFAGFCREVLDRQNRCEAPCA
jgi:glycosyltransferase involved in cell wall biosynthesis